MHQGLRLERTASWSHLTVEILSSLLRYVPMSLVYMVVMMEDKDHCGICLDHTADSPHDFKLKIDISFSLFD